MLRRKHCLTDKLLQKWIKFTKNLSSLHEKSVLHVNYKLSLIYRKRKYKKKQSFEKII